MPSKVTPWLWFTTEAEEAATFYVSLLDNSRITDVARYGPGAPVPEGTAMTVAFELDGRPFVALNGGQDFPFTEAVSLQISCTDQEEVDRLWAAITEDGEPGNCGWCKDKYGLSWQVIPAALPQLLADPDSDRAQRAMTAMLTMKKLDLEELRRAADGESATAQQ